MSLFAGWRGFQVPVTVCARFRGDGVPVATRRRGFCPWLRAFGRDSR